MLHPHWGEKAKEMSNFNWIPRCRAQEGEMAVMECTAGPFLRKGRFGLELTRERERRRPSLQDASPSHTYISVQWVFRLSFQVTHVSVCVFERGIYVRQLGVRRLFRHLVLFWMTCTSSQSRLTPALCRSSPIILGNAGSHRIKGRLQVKEQQGLQQFRRNISPQNTKCVNYGVNMCFVFLTTHNA